MHLPFYLGLDPKECNYASLIFYHVFSILQKVADGSTYSILVRGRGGGGADVRLLILRVSSKRGRLKSG